MAKDRKAITSNGKAAFYAAIWEDIRNAAMDCGWAVALHGSLSRDMDILAMPWIKDCTTAECLIDTIIARCFDNNIVSMLGKRIDKISKPHNRICYAIPIYNDFYLDISIMCPECIMSNTISAMQTAQVKGEE